MNVLLRDLRFAFRQLRRAPGFTLAAVACLTLGIGANAAIFTVINRVLDRPLPYPDPSRLVMVWSANPVSHDEHNVIWPADYLDWKARNQVFERMAAVADSRLNLTGEGVMVNR